MAPITIRAEQTACDRLKDLAEVGPVTLIARPNLDSDNIQVTLSGTLVAKKPDLQELRNVGAKIICEASLGTGLALNRVPICEGFGLGFGENATIMVKDLNIAYSLVSTTPGAGRLSFTRTNANACSPALSVVVEAGLNAHIVGTSSMPDVLTAQRAEFRPRDWSPHGDLSLDVGVAPLSEEVGVAPLSDDNKRSELPEPTTDSWFQLNPNGYLLLDLLQTVMGLFSAVAGFWIVTRYLMGIGSADALRKPWTGPLTAAVAITLAYQLTVPVILLTTWVMDLFDPSLIGRIYLFMFRRHVMEFWNIAPWTAGAFLLLLVGLAYWIIATIVFRRNPGNPFRLIGRIFLESTFLLFLAFVIAASFYLPGKEASIGYEPPALVLSAIFAGVALFSLKPALGIGRGTVLLLSLVAAGSILYPYDDTSASNFLDRAAKWFGLVSTQLGRSLFQAALLILARYVLQARANGSLDVRTTDLALLAALAMSIMTFKADHIADAAAILGLCIIAAHSILMTESKATETRQPSLPLILPDAEPGVSGPALGPEVGKGALLTGALATAIVWTQLFFAHAQGNKPPVHAMLIDSAFAFNTFSTATLAALFLGHSFARILGDSAVLKAMLVAAFIIGVNIASNISDLIRTGDALPAVTQFLSVIAALLIVAVFAFDYANARRRLKDFTIRDMFRGTTLGGAMPVIWGAAAAIISTLSPIILNQVGDAFREIVNKAIHHPAITAGDILQKPAGQGPSAAQPPGTTSQ